MTVPDPSADPRIQEAMADLERAELSLDRAVSEAEQLQQTMPPGGLSQEDIEQIEEHARGRNAPAELRELQQRIDDGELSWSDLAAGRFLDDPGVRAALEGGVEGMRQAHTMLQEGHDLDEIIEPGAPPVAIERPQPERGHERDDGDAEDGDPDDDFGGGSILR
ncbi:hypothetical protein [Saccharomonospora halophila]|uniref:hypothetical protein n=1 Tax=Saccharomonospora halophila TaxID=129922 RepID=UPI000382D518|nr:hypothetical protein [Saccharomonospora halophila]